MNSSDIAKLLDDAHAFPPLLSQLAAEAAKEIVTSGAFSEMPKFIELVIGR